jgi:hypothetical protein
MNTKETILWAVKVGDEDWQEQIITTDENQIEAAKEWASNNGFDRFRVAKIDLGVKPDFVSTLNMFEMGGSVNKRTLVVLDEGNGKIINDLFNEWNNISTSEEYENWIKKVKNTSFGTYGTITLNQVLENFEFDKSNVNEVKKRDFKKELNNAINKYEMGGEIYKRGGVVGQEIVFDDGGEENTGVIQEVNEITGDYVVDTDDGRTVLAQHDIDVISLGEMRKKPRDASRKKLFGLFEDGGNVDEMKIYFVPKTTIGGNPVQKTELRNYVKSFFSHLDKKENTINYYFSFDNNLGEVSVNNESDKERILSILKLWDFEDATKRYSSKMAKGGNVEKNIYKLRAEGLNDFLAFLQNGMYFRVKSFTVEIIGVPDVVVSFETDASLSEIKSKLREIPDSHVMLQTIEPINEYTGERTDEYAKGGNVKTAKIGDILTASTGVELKVVDYDPLFGGRVKVIRMDEYSDGTTSQWMPLSKFKSSSKMAKGASVDSNLKDSTYIPNRDIVSITIKKDGKNLKLTAKDILDGIYYKGVSKEKQSNGRGWESLQKGEKITDISQFEVGEVYLNYNPQFNSKNLIRITNTDKTGLKRPLVYASFVRNNGLEEDFAIWDYDLKDNEYYKPKSNEKITKGESTTFEVDDIVYNTRTKNVGLVRLKSNSQGKTKTDADGNVKTSELEIYNPIKFTHQKDAKAAPSTTKEIDSRGLYNPFSIDKINNLLWKSISDKFDSIYFTDYSTDKKLIADQVKADKTAYTWDGTRSGFRETLSWEEAESAFKKLLTEDEKNLIEISYNSEEYADAEEHDAETEYKTITVFRKDLMAKGGEVKATKNEDINECKKLVKAFCKEYGKTFNINEKEILSKVSFDAFKGHGASVFIGLNISSNINNLKVGEIKPTTSYISLSSDINPNGVSKEIGIARTYVIDFVIKGNQRKRGGGSEESTFFKAYQYGVTIDEVMDKFENKVLYDLFPLEQKNEIKYRMLKVYAKGGMTEHGLKVGDEIMGYTDNVNELHVINRKNNDEWHSVDLDDGKRYAKGGSVEGEVIYEPGIMISKPYYFKEGGIFTLEGYRINNKFYDNVTSTFIIAKGISTKAQAFKKAQAFYDFVKQAKTKESFDALTEKFISDWNKNKMEQGGKTSSTGWKHKMK